VVRIVRELTVDGFQDGMAFIPDITDAFEVGGFKPVQDSEKTVPPFIPTLEQRFPAGKPSFEFRIPIPPGFLPIRIQEIRPAREHVPRKVTGNHGDTVGIFIGRVEQLLGFQLFHRLFPELPVITEQLSGIFQKMGFDSHDLLSIGNVSSLDHKMSIRDPVHATPLRDIMPRMIRIANESDLSAIVKIYNASIPGRLATADTEPISMESRRTWLLDRDLARHPVWIWEDLKRPNRVCGWLSFKPFYGRPAYAATAEVSIYVDPAAQRSGVATRLMDHAVGQAPVLQLTTFLAFVFAHNAPSLELCRKFGFEEWGHLPRIAILDGLDRDLLILGKRL